MPVSVVRHSRTPGVSLRRVQAEAKFLLDMLGEAEGELVVALVGNREIRRLNREYRGRNESTDVLAFAMREGRRAPGDETLLGDVLISLPAAASQARKDGVPTAAAVRRLLIHGILHLLGYDHERSAPEARRMRAMERRLSRVLASRHLARAASACHRNIDG